MSDCPLCEVTPVQGGFLTSWGKKVKTVPPLSPESCHTRICQYQKDRKGCINSCETHDGIHSLELFLTDAERLKMAQRIEASVGIKEGLVFGHSQKMTVVCVAVNDNLPPIVVYAPNPSPFFASTMIGMMPRDLGDNPRFWWVKKTLQGRATITEDGVKTSPSEWEYVSTESNKDLPSWDLDEFWLGVSANAGPLFSMTIAKFREEFLSESIAA